MEDRHRSRIICKCALCLAVNREGCYISRQRYRSHQSRPWCKNRRLCDRLEKGGKIVCTCAICVTKCPGGVPFSHSGYMHHVQSVKIKEQGSSLIELQEKNVSQKGLEGINIVVDEIANHMHLDNEPPDQPEPMQNEAPMSNEADNLCNDAYDEMRIASLDDQFLACLVEIQSCLDMHNVPEKLQNDLFRLLFQSKAGSGLASIIAEKTIAEKGKWTGMVNGFRVPTSLKCMKQMYQDMGLPCLQRHTICIHDDGQAVYRFKVINDGVTLSCSCKRKINGVLVRTSRCLKHETCTVCQKTRKDGVTFLYNPISYILKLRCRSKSIGYSDIEHWRQRDTWLGKGLHESPAAISECWHARRWREMQYFWDPSTKWELPIICKHCQTILQTWPLGSRAECIIHAGFDSSTNHYIVTCPQCLREDSYARHECFGDPRNLALLLHWDGFQSTRSTVRSSGVVRLVALNGGKGQDSKVKELTFPVLFIPKEEINSGTNSLDPFLEPLIQELRNLYVTGLEVNYALDANVIHPGLPQVFRQRCILYAITADHPAQCEVLKLSSSGKVPCRRCDIVLSISSDNSYYYNDLLKRTRIPDKKKTMEHVFNGIEQLKDGIPNAARDTGVRGPSMFLSLYQLYGFDLLHHSAVDLMHTMALNMCYKCNKRMFEQVKQAGNERTAMERLQNVITARTRRMKDGRCPRDPFKRFGFFKAQEQQVFCQWYADYVLAGLVSEDDFSISQIVTDLTRIFFDYARTNGWTLEIKDVAKKLLQAWRIRWNELCGPNTSPLEHMAGECHILDDVDIIGPPDATWCYFFESTFAKLLQMPTNKKDMEVTYARVEARLLYSKIYRMNSLDRDGLLPHERGELYLRSALVGIEDGKSFASMSKSVSNGGIIRASSQNMAIELWSTYKRHNLEAWKNIISNKGILIGCGKARECTREEETYLQKAYGLSGLSQSIVTQYKGILLAGSIFTEGDAMVVQNEDICDGQWYGKLRYIFSHKEGSETSVYFAADYYRYQVLNASINLDEATGMPILAEGMEPFDYESILPVRYILREICILPMRTAGDTRSIALETKTVTLPNRLLQLHKPGTIPIWPLEEDVVAVQAIKHGSAPHLTSSDGCWYALVDAVNEKDKKVKITWLDLTNKRGARCLVPSYEEKRWQSWDCLLKVLTVRKSGIGRRAFYYLLD